MINGVKVTKISQPTQPTGYVYYTNNKTNNWAIITLANIDTG